jgi:hypothetical protein
MFRLGVLVELWGEKRKCADTLTGSCHLLDTTRSGPCPARWDGDMVLF